MKRRGQRYDYDNRSWWTEDHGGLPGWAIVLAIVVILALGVVVGYLALNPQ